jgi:hypothetical protein
VPPAGVSESTSLASQPIKRASVLERVLGDRPFDTFDLRSNGHLDARRWKLPQLSGGERVQDLALAGAHGNVGEATDLVAGRQARHDGY